MSSGLPAERERIRRSLGAIVGATNVLFDPFTLVSHATDATDWRLYLPAAVALPTEEGQVQPLLAAIAALGLHAIPRGAGTGLTGGSVPLRGGCVVVNTERLDRIRGIEERAFTLADGRTVRAHVMSLEAGVVTERAMEAASERGLNFATDPTSAWACTIGGNIAENAGGKTAVRYGTCIDNLLAWSVAMPGGSFTVRRLDHPLRKILPGDTVRWRVEDAAGREVRTIALAAEEIRKPGLWKDITNKALGGVPGLQKEGTDGVITAAEFILHPQYAAAATLCLEFFGDDMDEASEVILELVRAFPDEGAEALEALEHFDGQYVRAIDYRVKAARAGTPKAVLLIDVVGHDDAQLKRAVAKIRAILERHANTEVAVARDAAEAKRFWADRKRLGAIAARTNAFKLNEDIVLPLEALAEFSRWVDGVNLEEERENLAELARRLRDFFEEAPSQEDPQWLGGKIARALDLCEEALEALSWEDAEEMRGGTAVEGLLAALRELARGYPEVAAGIEGIVRHVRSRLVVLATHMHAGDGNVHVNIPVMSNDRAMLRRAEAAVDRLMEKAAALGGVCSGEHGIGVTKLKYLDPALREALAAYRRTVDPGGLMNPGKLDDLAALELIFTPSFNLLELEARILRHGQLEELALKIAHCVRCGKCKPDCCVFYPARGLFYHPRNKNLAIGALIEALLYDAQRERGGAFELLRNLEQVADHCTLCHKCLKPCPVGIDTGEVSVLERDILAAHDFKHTALATRATLGVPRERLADREPALSRGGARRGRRGPAARVARGAAPAGRGRRGARLALRVAAAAPRRARAARRAPPLRAGSGARVRAGRRGESDRLLLPRVRLRAALRFGRARRAAPAAGARGAGGAAAPVPLLRLPGLRHRAHRDARADLAARRHPLRPDPRDVQPPGLRRGGRHLRHLPRGARRAGGRQDLRVRGGGRGAAGARSRRARRDHRRRSLPRALPRLARRPRGRAARRRGRHASPRCRTAAPRPGPSLCRAPTSPAPCCTESARRSPKRAPAGRAARCC